LDHRPQAQELLSFCGKKKNNIDAVIVWRLDRLSRNNTDYHGEIKPLLEQKGIKLLSATEANNDTIEGELMRNISMDFAEYERKLIGVRTLAGMKEKAAQGQYPHKAPIGYKNVTMSDKSKKIIIDEDRAFYIKRAFNLYDSGLYSLKSLTKNLQDDGLRNAKGNKIPKSSVEKILKNIFYTGVFEYEGTIRENAQHPAIISKELYYRVQDRLIDPNKRRKHNIDFAYTGLIRCGQCGYQLTGEIKKDRHGEYKYIYYHCTGYKGGDCKRDYITETKIDKAISEITKLIVIPKDIREDVAKALKIVHEKKNDYSEQAKSKIFQHIITLEKRIENAYTDKLDGVISYEQWKRNNVKWQIEKDKLYLQLNEMKELDKQFYEKSDLLLGFTENVHEYFSKGSANQKRRILEIIAEEITYKDKELNIKLRPIFQTIVENQRIFAQNFGKYRNTEKGINKGVETNSTPKYRKNSL